MRDKVKGLFENNDLALLLAGVVTILVSVFLLNPLIQEPFTIMGILALVGIIIIFRVFITIFKKVLGNKNINIGSSYMALGLVSVCLFIVLIQ
ncbi:hypothetical protein GCM10007063_30740 [Lentibacillus kapialis]|uniref:Uncharacterized protein n=1 Tax=Lentibacillus kapialis TaxID=340214 RepID=A0A917Q1C9_9BACI|nr:hypothetical protein [Lentibacillus kapialis]GGK06106.1 hypothetical protein GCM10007063_30740 [Lentibacillus kapialis]